MNTHAFLPDEPADFPFGRVLPPEIPSFGTSIVFHGAVEEDKGVCTEAFRDAIAECAAMGGGTVIVPKGVWLTGPIHFRSRIRLHLDSGAIVRFSRDIPDYLPRVLSQRAGAWLFNYSPQLYGLNAEHIAITGEGEFDGQGDVWWHWKENQPGMEELFAMMSRGTPVKDRIFGTPEAGIRPPMLQFMDCRNILIEGVSFRNGPSWMIHPVRCENLTIRGISLFGEGHNNDGIDPDCCRNVLIEDCRVDAGDDCIVLKAGRDQDGWAFGKPTENVVIRRVTSRQGHAGFGIGSELSAGVRNVLVEDCSFSNTKTGFLIKSTPGRGGFVENVTFRRNVINRLHVGAVIIRLDYGNPARGEGGWAFASTTNEPTRVENIHVQDLFCGCFGAEQAIELVGDKRLPLRKIRLDRIDLRARRGIEILHVEGLEMTDVSVRTIA